MAALQQKNIFLTGASSGIGQATAHLLSQNGYAVWGTTRNPQKLPPQTDFHPLEMRLEETDTIGAAWNEAVRQAGQIDVIIQNAGAGIYGAIEDVSLTDAHWQWQVLVEGPLHLLQLAAGHLRPRREGLIIGVSSLAAELPMPFSAHYSAGKAAFSAFLAGLSMELKPFKVRVVDLRPGDICTPFNDHLPKTMPTDSAYLPWTQTAWQKLDALLKAAPSAELVARAILKIVQAEKSPHIVRSGTFFQATMGPLGALFLPRQQLLNSIRSYYSLDKVDGQK